MPSNKYFLLQPNLLPDFGAYYAGFGAAAQGHIQFMSTVTPDINGDGKPDIVLFINQMQTVLGTVTSGPTPNREIILGSQADGTYKDITANVLGSATSPTTGFSLNGYSNETVVADINGDGKPDIIIAESHEDGRSVNNASFGNAVSQVQLSQPDGSYKTVDIGTSYFGGRGSIQVLSTSAGPEIFLGAYGSTTGSSWISLANGPNGAYTDPIYKLNTAGTGFDLVGMAPTNAYGSAVLSTTKIVDIVHYTNSSGVSGQGYAVGTLGNGQWSFGAVLAPYSNTVITNFVSWNMDHGSTNVYNVNGQLVSAGLPSILGTFQSTPTSDTYVVTQLEASLLSAPRSDGNYYQSDGSAFSKIDFWKVVGTTLVAAPLNLVGENTALSVQQFQFIDINHDGLLDFVSNNRSGPNGGQGIVPDVYLNDGAGSLIHVDKAFFPTADISGNWAGFFADFNGDGKYDLLYNPWYPGTYAGAQIYYGTSNFESAITQSIVVSNRNGGTSIATGAGNDTFYDTNANTTAHIDGGLGINTSIYGHNAGTYTVTHNSDGSTTVAGNGLTDTLVNIGRLQFADKKVAMDLNTTQSAGEAALLVGAVVGKAGLTDQATMGQLITFFDTGATLHDAANVLVNAGVLDRIAGGSSVNSYVNMIYKAVVGQTATPDVTAALAGYINSGTYSKADFLSVVADLPLNQANVGLVGMATTGIAYS